MVKTAYVFIHLPSQTRATIAGRFERYLTPAGVRSGAPSGNKS